MCACCIGAEVACGGAWDVAGRSVEHTVCHSCGVFGFHVLDGTRQNISGILSETCDNIAQCKPLAPNCRSALELCGVCLEHMQCPSPSFGVRREHGLRLEGLREEERWPSYATRWGRTGCVCAIAMQRSCAHVMQTMNGRRKRIAV